MTSPLPRNMNFFGVCLRWQACHSSLWPPWKRHIRAGTTTEKDLPYINREYGNPFPEFCTWMTWKNSLKLSLLMSTVTLTVFPALGMFNPSRKKEHIERIRWKQKGVKWRNKEQSEVDDSGESLMWKHVIDAWWATMLELKRHINPMESLVYGRVILYSHWAATSKRMNINNGTSYRAQESSQSLGPYSRLMTSYDNRHRFLEQKMPVGLSIWKITLGFQFKNGCILS